VSRELVPIVWAIEGGGVSLTLTREKGDLYVLRETSGAAFEVHVALPRGITAEDAQLRARRLHAALAMKRRAQISAQKRLDDVMTQILDGQTILDVDQPIERNPS
jgi:hypothetical protein